MEMLHPTFALLRADVVAEAAATSLAHGGVPTRGLAATPALMPKDAPPNSNPVWAEPRWWP